MTSTTRLRTKGGAVPEKPKRAETQLEVHREQISQNADHLILTLQRSVGNQAVLRLLASRGIQVKASPSPRGAPPKQDVELAANRFEEQFKKHFGPVRKEFPKDPKQLYALFSSWQHAQLTMYFLDKTIPESLFTSPKASQKIDPGLRVLLAAQILTKGKRDVSDVNTPALRGGPWVKGPHVRALYCGHWVKLVWNYAGVNPGALNTGEDIVGPTGRISFGGGGTRKDLLPMGWIHLTGLERHGTHEKRWIQAKITAVFDHSETLRVKLLSIGRELAGRQLRWAAGGLKRAQKYSEYAAAEHERMRKFRTDFLRRRPRPPYNERLAVRKQLVNAGKERWKAAAGLTYANNWLKRAKREQEIVAALEKKPRFRRASDMEMEVLAKLGVGEDRDFEECYRQLSPGKRDKIDKDWARRPIMGASMFTKGNIRRGDHLWCYDANASGDGGHSVVFVRWLDRKGFETQGKTEVHYREAAVYSQLGPTTGGRHHKRLLGYPYARVAGRRVYPVTAVFRPVKGKRGGPGPPRKMGELLHFSLHRANEKNLKTLAAMRRGKGPPETIDLGKLAAFLRKKASELLKHPNLAALEPAQRTLCQQIVTRQSGATIDNISNLVALCQKLLNPISFAKNLRGKRITVNGVLSWPQLGLETPAKRKPLESAGGAATSWKAMQTGAGLGGEFELDLAIEFNRSLMNKEGIPSRKLRDLGTLVANNRHLRRLPARTKLLGGSVVRLQVLKDYHRKHTGSNFKGLESLSILVGIWQALRQERRRGKVTGMIGKYSDIVASDDLKALRTGTPRK